MITKTVLEKVAEPGNQIFDELGFGSTVDELVDRARVIHEDAGAPLINDPTAVLQEDIVEPEIPQEKTWEKDKAHGKFLGWLRQQLENLPRHSGRTTVGCERVIARLKKLNAELSRALHSDENNEIDEEEAERLRDLMLSYIDRLQDACDKMLAGKKSRKTADLRVGKKVFVRIAEDAMPEYYITVSDASGDMMLPVEIVEPTNEQVQAVSQVQNGSMKKEAFHTKIHLIADPFLNEITRLLIEGHVSHGRPIEKLYQKLDSRYKFSDRDHLAIQSLLREKGLHLNKDLSRLGEDVYPWEGGADSDKSYPA